LVLSSIKARLPVNLGLERLRLVSKQKRFYHQVQNMAKTPHSPFLRIQAQSFRNLFCRCVHIGGIV
ncbi:hypothetical protein CI102_15073, partial [Trichoderma harzianum]